MTSRESIGKNRQLVTVEEREDLKQAVDNSALSVNASIRIFICEVFVPLLMLPKPAPRRVEKKVSVAETESRRIHYEDTISCLKEYISLCLGLEN